ncbi:MAG TPA: hypothetical protein VGB39_02310, partial [Sphingomicrobium sp.]
MIDYQTRRLQARISGDQAYQSFRGWLKGALPGARSEIRLLPHHVEQLELPFVRARVRVSGRWSAMVGIFDHGRWTREMHNFQRESDWHGRSGSSRREPRRPDKTQFLDWVAEQGDWDDEFTIVYPAFDSGLLAGDETILKFCAEKAMGMFTLWDDAEIAEADRLPLEPSFIEEGCRKGIDEQLARAVHERLDHIHYQVDAITGENLQWEASYETLLIPFNRVEYRWDDEDHLYVQDALFGASGEGSCPKVVRKRRLAPPAAVSLALMAAGLYGASFYMGIPPAIAAASQTARTEIDHSVTERLNHWGSAASAEWREHYPKLLKRAGIAPGAPEKAMTALWKPHPIGSKPDATICTGAV